MATIDIDGVFASPDRLTLDVARSSEVVVRADRSERKLVVMALLIVHLVKWILSGEIDGPETWIGGVGVAHAPG